MLKKELKTKEIRVRYAPSPTGFLHIGGARTALFNYLFARKHGGSFILRIEDTDRERFSPEYEEDIIKSLLWLGIQWDEGPAFISDFKLGKPKKYIGEYGPYRQSERQSLYANYLKKLLAEKKAYYCFCSKEELEAQRQYQISIGQPPRYTGKCRNLTEEEVTKYLAEGRPSIIRLKTPAKKVIFEDIIRGRIEFDSSLLGDFPIAKSLTSPLYNFAVVVDDFEMKITHVIRGEDHLPNTPKQILIQEALGFPTPSYAHLPLILGPDRTKLSKRHGAVSVSEYKKAGYLPEAIINFMALLGWNPGDEREIFSMTSLIKEFSLKNIQKGGAIFNIKKLDWINGFYIRQKSIDKLTELCLPYLIEKKLITPLSQISEFEKTSGSQELKFAPQYLIEKTGEKVSVDFIKKIVALYQERLKTLSEIAELTDFFFKDKLEYDKNLLKWKDMSEKEIEKSLDNLIKILSKIKVEAWNKTNLENILLPAAFKFSKQIKKPVGDRGYLLWPFRVALSGKKASAGPFEIAEVLGKEKTIKRLKEAKERIQ